LSIRWYHLFENAFIHTSVVFPRQAALSRVGGYDESMAYAEDHALWSRLMQLGRTMNLEQRLVDYRTHTASITGTPSGVVQERTTTLRRLLHTTIRRHFAAVFGEAPREDDVDVLCGFALGLEA